MGGWVIYLIENSTRGSNYPSFSSSSSSRRRKGGERAGGEEVGGGGRGGGGGGDGIGSFGNVPEDVGGRELVGDQGGEAEESGEEEEGFFDGAACLGWVGGWVGERWMRR